MNDLLAALSGGEPRRPLRPLGSAPPVDALPSTRPAHDVQAAATPAAADEPQFEEACRKLREAPSKPSFLALAIVSAFAVAWMLSEEMAVSRALILALVLLFHEAGHFVAMRAFGYRDVRVFFLPFFGAMTMGRKERASSLQSAVVALAGPLPGLLLGIALLLLPATRELPVARTTAVTLFLVNALNLLPVEPLDGGRLLSALIFSRNHRLEGYFLGATTLGLVAIGWTLKSTLFYVLAASVFVFLPTRVRNAKGGAAIRKRCRELPVQLDAAPEAYLRELFSEAKLYLRGTPQSAVIASTMRSIHERAEVQLATPAATAGLLALYVATWGAVFLILAR